MSEQCCIGSRTSKSVCNWVNWGRSDNKYHRTTLQASKMIYNFPVESRQTRAFSQYFGPRSYKAWDIGGIRTSISHSRHSYNKDNSLNNYIRRYSSYP